MMEKFYTPKHQGNVWYLYLFVCLTLAPKNDHSSILDTKLGDLFVQGVIWFS